MLKMIFRKKLVFISIILLLLWINKIVAQERPFIWVKTSEQKDILEKIEQQAWAASLYEKFMLRLDKDFNEYQKNPREYLSGIPIGQEHQVKSKTPPLKIVDYSKPGGPELADTYMRYLQVGIDCGVAYYLTKEDKYAQCALDILHSFVGGLVQIPPSEDKGNGGWLYPDNHLREAREVGAQIPVIYDFVMPFILKGGKPFDLRNQTKVAFSIENAQQVFRTYANMAIDHGMTGSNWSVLEAPSMVQNTLALEDKNEREKLLKVYLTDGSDRQNPLSEIASHFQKEGDVYPETSQYSNGVAAYSTILMTILTKYEPSLQLGRKYVYLPLALSRWEALKYPNDEIVRFGDGKRHGGTDFSDCEIAYYLGKIEGIEQLTGTFGPLLKTAIVQGEYSRDQLDDRSFGANVYFDPLKLLWFTDEIEGDVAQYIPPRSDDMPHASVFLQRNLSATKKAEDGLMCFVGGAHMVHGHASGMDMELYGKGQVLGVDNGRGSYGQDIHENYSRIFAAHNSVIVNGASRSDGGWVNLGINPVKLERMEPMPRQDALSPYHSFTQTSFIDDKGEGAEAKQQRTLALIRTSDTSGYYVDIFRSKSTLPNEYHDYLYHNIGDRLSFLNTDLQLNKDPDRYQANANDTWLKNRQYRHPGWHFFEEVQSSSNYSKDLKAVFSLEKLEGKSIFMGLHIPGFNDRQYTKVMAPRTFQAPAPYDEMATPTLVIRKKGQAWDSPFVVVYEPFSENANKQSVQKVEKLEQNGLFKALKIISRVGGKKLTQIVISQPENIIYENAKLGIFFKGTFAVITLDSKNKLKSLYMGDGEELVYGKVQVSAEEKSCGAFVEFSGSQPKIYSNGKVILREKR